MGPQLVDRLRRSRSQLVSMIDQAVEMHRLALQMNDLYPDSSCALAAKSIQEIEQSASRHLAGLRLVLEAVEGTFGAISPGAFL